MKKMLQTVFVTCVISTGIIAQPSLTAIGINPVAGDQFINIGSPYMSPGSGGAGQTWNFSSMATSSTSTISVVTASSTAYGVSFPNANIATTANSTNFEYFKTSSAAYQAYGSAGSTNLDSYSNPEDRLQFPFTYNNTYTDVFTSTYMNGSTTVYRYGWSTVTADGYGTLTTPAGTFNNVLRVHQVLTYHDSSTGPSVNVFKRDQYLWYLNGNHSSLASVNSFTLIPATGSTVTNQGAGYLASTTTGIITANDFVNSCVLFPNPAANNIQLKFILREEKAVSIKLFNSLGAQVETINGNGVPGNNEYKIDISTLPEGIYFAQVFWGGNVNYTRRFVVYK